MNQFFTSTTWFRVSTIAIPLLVLSLLCRESRADIATANPDLSATILTSGPRTGTSGTGFFNVGVNNIASGNPNPSFGVLDFSSDDFSFGFPVADVTTLTLALTEENFAGTRPSGALNFYLSQDTTTSIAAAGASPLVYQTANAPEGIGTQLSPLTLLGTGVFSINSGADGTGTVDTYTLNLSGTAETYFINQLNTSGLLRLVVTPTDTSGYSTWAGSTNFNVARRPKLTIDAILNNPTLAWVGGDGVWNDTNANWRRPDTTLGPWNPARTAQFNVGSGTVTMGSPLDAVGLQFDVDDYTVAGNATNVLTLTGSATSGEAAIRVTNVFDTATVTARIALDDPNIDALVKTGAGTLILGGANTFVGQIVIREGILYVSSEAPLGDSFNGILLDGGTFKTASTIALGADRDVFGTGGIDVAPGTTLTISGETDVLDLVLSNSGTLVLSSTGNTVAGVRFTGAGTLDSTVAPLTAPGNITTTHTAGTAQILGNLVLSGATRDITVADGTAAVDLRLPGDLVSTSVLRKLGPGTLELTGDNSALTASFRHGLAGSPSAVGGTISFNNNKALGVGQYQFNSGTLNAMVPLVGATALPATLSFSIGAGQTGEGAAFTGSNIEITGPVSLFKGFGSTYEHVITVHNTTTISGTFGASAGSGTSTGLTVNGSGTLILSGSANAFAEALTVNARVVAAADKALGQGSVTVRNGTLTRLTINAGVTDAIADNVMLSLLSDGVTFGKLELGGAANVVQETVGGLFLGAPSGSLANGFQPAGTYGSSLSGAMFQNDQYFSGTGMLNNLAVVPETSSSILLVMGVALLMIRPSMRRRGRALHA